MAKKTDYKEKSLEELVLELAKLRGGMGAARMEKRKTGNALSYRTTRKNIARIMTIMNAKMDK